MRRPPTKVRVAGLLAIGACGVWWLHDPVIAVAGFGFAAAALVAGRRHEVVESLTFVGLGAVALAGVVRGRFDVWAPFDVLVGVGLIAFGAFSLWLLRREPRS